VVGGSYAAGHLDAFEEWARSLRPRNIFGYLDIRLDGSGLIERAPRREPSLHEEPPLFAALIQIDAGSVGDTGFE
jgi:hypothetical protein